MGEPRTGAGVSQADSSFVQASAWRPPGQEVLPWPNTILGSELRGILVPWVLGELDERFKVVRQVWDWLGRRC